MRWHFETFEQKLKRCEEWRDWFAWYPVRTGYGDWAWLETVRAKAEFFVEPGYYGMPVRSLLWKYERK